MSTARCSSKVKSEKDILARCAQTQGFKHFTFSKALERESEDNKRLPKGKKRNRACRLVYGVFREYFVHLASRRPEWIEVVNKFIVWEEFVVHTMKNADEMRRCARLADAPNGNEFLFVVNALFRCKNYFPLGVYRYRKKNYVRTMLDRFEKVSLSHTHTHTTKGIMRVSSPFLRRRKKS